MKEIFKFCLKPMSRYYDVDKCSSCLIVHVIVLNGIHGIIVIAETNKWVREEKILIGSTEDPEIPSTAILTEWQ